MDNLKHFLSRFQRLTDEELAAFQAVFTPFKIQKLNHLFLEGETVSSLFYIDGGLMRGYYNQGDQEITTNFYFGPTMMTDLISVRTGQPTRMNVQALKDCHGMAAKFSDIDDLTDRFENIQLVFFNLLEHLYLFGVMRQHSFIFNTPQERYINLFAERPKVIAEIPQRYISSYLGITPESLSRIRKRIFSE